MTDNEIQRELRRKWGAYELSKAIRARNKRNGKCINGPTHDAPTSGVRCDWCKDVHRRGLAAVLAAPRFARPPETKWRKRRVA